MNLLKPKNNLPYDLSPRAVITALVAKFNVILAKNSQNILFVQISRGMVLVVEFISERCYGTMNEKTLSRPLEFDLIYSEENSVLSRKFSSTEEKIMRAFLRICHQSGIESVTLEKVARQAKVGFSTVRYHFALQNRQNMTDSACIFLIQQAYRWIEEKMNLARKSKKPVHLIQTYLRVMMDWVEKETDLSSFLIYYYYLNASEKRVVFKNEVLVAGAVQRIQSLIFEMIGNGSLPKMQDPKLLARRIHQVVAGACIVAKTNFDFKDQEENAWKSIQDLLRQNAVEAKIEARRQSVELTH